MTADESTDPFPGIRDFSVPLGGPDTGDRAFFGRNVLQGLIDGIADYASQRQSRWLRRSWRASGPVLLGCSPWVGDDKLIAAISALPSACVVLSKPRADARATDRLRAANAQTRGIELRALSGLANVAPKENGQARIVGPYDGMQPEDLTLPTFRAIGQRRSGRELPPHAHAKLALLGNICWTDEDPVGGVTDYVWFRPERLWISSANFTLGSRRSLEFGYWTEDSDLIRGVELFLTDLIGNSEDIDAPDDPDPELAPVEFDDAAMAEAYREHLNAQAELAEIEAADDEP